MNSTTENSSGTTPEEGRAGPLEKFRDAMVKASWQSALRFAAELDGARERCKRRACATAKSCCLQWEEGKPVDCGGGVSEETVRLAFALSFFGTNMVERYAVDVVVPEQKELRARLWKEFGVPLDA